MCLVLEYMVFTYGGMRLLSSDNEDQLVESIYGLNPFLYNGTGYTINVVQDWEDIPKRDDPFIIMTFMNTDQKVGQSLDNYLGPRENVNYNNYGYGEYDYCSIKAFARHKDGYHGKKLSREWIGGIESYIKNSWDDLITGGSVNKYSFGHNKLVNPYVRNQHGFEVNFKLATTNSWTDEPASGARIPVGVSGIHIETGLRIIVEV